MKHLVLTFGLFFTLVLNFKTEVLAQDYFYYYQSKPIHLSVAVDKYAIRFAGSVVESDKETFLTSAKLKRLSAWDGVAGYTLVQNVDGPVAVS